MAGTEDISLRVVLDDRQAKDGLDGLRMQTDAVAQAADAGAGGMGVLSQRMDSVNKLAGPAASAISGVTGAVGGLSSQVSAAVGAVANLAGAFASGGPLALGIVAIGTGISWLSTKYAESAKEAAAAEKAQVDAAKATANRIQSLTQGMQGRISAALGIDDATIALGQMQVKVQEAQASLDSLLSEEGRTNFMWLQAENKNLENGTEAYAKAVEEAQQNLSDLDLELANAEGAYREYSKQLAIANRLEVRKKELDDQAKAALTGKTAAIKENTDAAKRAAEAERAAQKAQEDAAAAVGPTREMFEQELNQRAVKARQDADKARTEAEKEEAEKRKKIADDEKKAKEDALKATTGNIMAATGIIVSASDQLLSDLITGQEKALERFAAAIFKQAGTVMLGKGLELGATGVANLLSGNPVQMALAGGQLAGAAGLVAGGLALGAVATGIEHTVMGASAATTTTATASAGPATTSTPMGAGRISGSQREGGGRVQEAVTYVFNAPVFGDQNRSAKHVALLQRRASRDLLLA